MIADSLFAIGDTPLQMSREQGEALKSLFECFASNSDQSTVTKQFADTHAKFADSELLGAVEKKSTIILGSIFSPLCSKHSDDIHNTFYLGLSGKYKQASGNDQRPLEIDIFAFPALIGIRIMGEDSYDNHLKMVNELYDPKEAVKEENPQKKMIKACGPNLLLPGTKTLVPASMYSVFMETIFKKIKLLSGSMEELLVQEIL